MAFTIQFKSCIFETQPKSNHDPKQFLHVKSKSKGSPKIEKYSFLTIQIPQSFPSTQCKSRPDPKFLKRFYSPASSEISDLCPFSELSFFLSYFFSQIKQINLAITFLMCVV